jgi:hypothetical protein
VLLELNHGFSPVPTNGSVAGTRIFLRECQGGFHRRQKLKSGEKIKKRTSLKPKTRTLILVKRTGSRSIFLLKYTRYSLEESIRTYTSG